MARVTIELPATFAFSTDLEVRIEHINRGNHLGNDSMVSYLNEARVRYMNEEINSAKDNNIWMINGDLAVCYKSEAFYGEVLHIQLATGDFHKYGFDLFFRVTEKNSGREVVHAKMGMLLFDAINRKLVQPEGGVEAYLRRIGA